MIDIPRKEPMLRFISSAAFGAALLACSAQTDTAYHGEALAELTGGLAPGRTTGAGALTVLAGLHIDIALGFALLAEAGFSGQVYSQEDASGTSLGPHFLFRQVFGASKTF